MQSPMKKKAVLALVACCAMGILAACTQTEGTATAANVPNMEANIENPM
ncbi:hypothetical protein [Thioclava sp. JE_KL1]|nr:hypothetical protein [Thioclava sp. JE_KL1]